MLSMWLVSSLGIKLVFGLDWNYALIAGACVTPTDPVLASSIIQGSFAESHIPLNVRYLLSAESAANDGLGLGFLMLPLYLSRISPPGKGLGMWLAKVMLYEIALSVLVGAVVGSVARVLLKLSQENRWTDKESILGFSIALALTVSGSLALLGMDDILACYVAGLALSWDQWMNRVLTLWFANRIVAN
jgi:NhaP-type Na+/H+ or K+/H+ antiporter